MCQKLYRSRCGQVVVLVFLGLLFNLCTAQANDLPRANAMRTVTPVRSSGGGTLAELRDSRNPPAETPRLNIKGSAQLDRLQACDDRLAEYRQLAHALNQASCNRFGEEKYARLLKSRNEPCRGMPQDAVAGQVPGAVVDSLEVVQVKHDERHRVLKALAAPQLLAVGSAVPPGDSQALPRHAERPVEQDQLTLCTASIRLDIDAQPLEVLQVLL